MTDNKTILKIKDAFLSDKAFETKLAFLSNGAQTKVINGSLKGETQEAFIECLLSIAQVLSEITLQDELKSAVNHVLSLLPDDNHSTFH